MPRLHAGLLRDAAHPCLACGAPGAACWCSGAPRSPRHDEGALAGLPFAFTASGLRA